MTTIRTIDSPANPTVKAVAKLRNRRERDRQARIVIDGLREVERAFDSGVTIDQIFLPKGSELDRDSLSAWTTDLVELSVPAYERVTFGNRSEVVATARTPTRRLDDISLSATPLIAVVEGIEKPGNIGAIFRSADAAGIDCVVLLDPVTDIFNPNAIRASLGTIFSVPLAACSFSEYQTWARSHGIVDFLARCEQAMLYTNVDLTQPCAFVLGSEANGLSASWEPSEFATSIRIPMHGLADSLNVSTAATVLFYEAKRQRDGE